MGWWVTLRTHYCAVAFVICKKWHLAFPRLQVIGPTEDGKPCDASDAQLNLSRGQPRFYIMRLPHRGRCFDRITFHANVTQCLGALAPVEAWYLVVGKPTLDVSAWPRWDAGQLTAFRIPHGVFVALKEGTWHAGPLFDGPFADFYNLELADTNVVDHNTHDYGALNGITLEVID